MVAATEGESKASFQVTITEHGVTSHAGIFGYDPPKTVEEHYRDFCDIGGAKLIVGDQGEFALQCGVGSGVIVIRIGVNRGDFVSKLDPGRYGVAHTNIGNLLRRTKRIVDTNNRTVHAVFGVVREHWPDGFYSCALVQQDLQGRGAIDILADGSSQPIEPTPGFRFYTPFKHIPGAGGEFLTPDGKSIRGDGSVYPLYPTGTMTLNRVQLSGLLRGFNPDWSNGPVFANANKIGEQQSPQSEEENKKDRRRKKKKSEGLDRWC